jgi:hypothetical protein
MLTVTPRFFALNTSPSAPNVVTMTHSPARRTGMNALSPADFLAFSVPFPQAGGSAPVIAQSTELNAMAG